MFVHPNPFDSQPSEQPKGKTKVVTTMDPTSGEEVKQIVQTIVDPRNGKVVEITLSTQPELATSHLDEGTIHILLTMILSFFCCKSF